MRKRNLAVPGLLAAAVVLAGACSDVPPTEPLVTAPTIEDLFRAPAINPAAELDGTLDAAFVRIAQEVPGFGGLFYDEAGTLNVYMTDVAQARSAAAVATALRTHLPALRLDAGTLQQARVRQAEYDFIQLSTMYRQVRPVHGIAGVVFSDADEAANRVRIGVENATAEADVRRALAMLNVPSEAVIIELTEPIEPMQTLRDAIRPIGGGLQIWRFIPPNQASTCTLGFNVRSPAAPDVHGFVTNSHCTAERGVVTPATWSQKALVLPAEPIATEEFDLPFFTGGICPEGRRCRYSDAAGARYHEGVNNLFGAIYKTTEPGQHGPASLDIDPVNPRFTIVNERPFSLVGETAHKVGRTTGWLIGPVINTCQTTTTAPNITIFCQDRVEATPQGGDSGSPVFQRVGETLDVHLVGILWGGSSNTYVYSPMHNVRCENEGPAAWITFPGQVAPPTPQCVQ